MDASPLEKIAMFLGQFFPGNQKIDDYFKMYEKFARKDKMALPNVIYSSHELTAFNAWRTNPTFLGHMLFI